MKCVLKSEILVGSQLEQLINSIIMQFEAMIFTF